MPKRFTDSNKFRDAWYRQLTIKQKCIWEYMLSECNHYGILELDFASMTFHIGTPIKQKDLSGFENKIFFLKENRIYIPNFVQFQYPKISSSSKVQAHKSVVDNLAKYNISLDDNIQSLNQISLPFFKGLPKACLSTKDKDKDKDKDKNNIIEQSFTKFWEAYPRKEAKPKAYTKFAILYKDDNNILDTILKALNWQKDTEQWQDKKYIPLPATYLNQARYDDEPPFKAKSISTSAPTKKDTIMEDIKKWQKDQPKTPAEDLARRFWIKVCNVKGVDNVDKFVDNFKPHCERLLKYYKDLNVCLKMLMGSYKATNSLDPKYLVDNAFKHSKDFKKTKII